MEFLSAKTTQRLMLVAKVVVFLLVAAGVAWTVRRALQDVREREFSLSSLDYRWIIVAGAAYLIGISPCWAFWHRTLHAMGQSPTMWESFRAYYISHLGKYVPGKAMVVVIRTGWIRSPRTDMTIAAVSVFVETLTMMAMAAFTSAAILLVFYRENIYLLLLAPALMICAGLPTLPPILRRIVRVARVKKINPDIEQALEGISYPLMLSGWSTIFVGWLFLGTSLWAVLLAIPGVNPTITDLPLLVVCVALPSVAGFLSFIPGGLGVRELVATVLLVNALHISELDAGVSAIMLRLSWLLAEGSILVILYVVSRIFVPVNGTSVNIESKPSEELSD